MSVVTAASLRPSVSVSRHHLPAVSMQALPGSLAPYLPATELNTVVQGMEYANSMRTRTFKFEVSYRRATLTHVHVVATRQGSGVSVQFTFLAGTTPLQMPYTEVQMKKRNRFLGIVVEPDRWTERVERGLYAHEITMINDVLRSAIQRHPEYLALQAA